MCDLVIALNKYKKLKCLVKLKQPTKLCKYNGRIRICKKLIFNNNENPTQLTIRNFFAMGKVPDVCRYVVEVDENGDITNIKENEDKGVNSSSYNDILAENIPREQTTRTIVILLESPHNDEYWYIEDNNQNNRNYEGDTIKPIAPAQGTTGNNIDEHIECFLKRSIDTLDEGKYHLILCNPVQFQTSLHYIHGLGISNKKVSGVRDAVWNSIWNKRSWNSQDGEYSTKCNFCIRLHNYKPSLIINCCTGGEDRSGLRSIVTEFLEKINLKCKIIEANHPSGWNSWGIKKIEIR